MGTWSLDFEPTDLAGWLWGAVAMLALLQAVRYLRHGRFPASMPSRSVVVAALVAILIAGWTPGSLRFNHTTHGWACLALALLLIPLVLQTYRRTTRPVNRQVARMLLGCRLVAVAIIVLLLAQPVLRAEIERRERAVVAFLLDTSASMEVKDVAADAGAEDGSKAVPRVEAVRRLLASNNASLRRLADRLDVRWFAFDRALRETREPELSTAGSQTALSEAIRDVQASLAQTGAKVAGVVLLSDGRDTLTGASDPEEVVEALATAGIPLYAVGIGSELPAGQTRLLRGRRLDLPDHVSVLNQLDVAAEFFASGLADVTVNVELLFDDQTVSRQSITPTQVQELLRVSLSHVPREGGLHRVTVRATANGLPPEQGRAERSGYVRVTDDKIQVLYLDRPRYERAAIGRALELCKDFHVTRLDPMPSGEGGAASPRVENDWRLYHVVLIGDMSRASLPDAAMEQVRRAVFDQGKGAALLGGLRTLGSGDYAGSALAWLFPVQWQAGAPLPGPVEFELTPAGQVHPICQLADTREGMDAIWKLLPPFTGADRLSGLGPTAEILLRARGGEPLLVTQEMGKGRVAVAAFDSTWQWAFADERGLEAQRRFWRQIVLWLANRKPQVWVMPDRPQYDLVRLTVGGEQVVIRGGISDATSGGPAEHAALTGRWIGPGGESRPITWRGEAEGFRATLPAREAGVHRVEVEGRVGDQVVGTAEAAFVVESVDRERADPLADLETLRRMAARTGSIGGDFVPMSEFGRLLERIRASGHETRIRRVESHHLVDDYPWAWWIVFVGLLTVEWVVRRRAGLV